VTNYVCIYIYIYISTSVPYIYIYMGLKLKYIYIYIYTHNWSHVCSTPTCAKVDLRHFPKSNSPEGLRVSHPLFRLIRNISGPLPCNSVMKLCLDSRKWFVLLLSSSVMQRKFCTNLSTLNQDSCSSSLSSPRVLKINNILGHLISFLLSTRSSHITLYRQCVNSTSDCLEFLLQASNNSGFLKKFLP